MLSFYYDLSDRERQAEKKQNIGGLACPLRASGFLSQGR